MQFLFKPEEKSMMAMLAGQTGEPKTVHLAHLYAAIIAAVVGSHCAPGRLEPETHQQAYNVLQRIGRSLACLKRYGEGYGLDAVRDIMGMYELKSATEEFLAVLEIGSLERLMFLAETDVDWLKAQGLPLRSA